MSKHVSHKKTEIKIDHERKWKNYFEDQKDKQIKE